MTTDGPAELPHPADGGRARHRGLLRRHRRRARSLRREVDERVALQPRRPRPGQRGHRRPRRAPPRAADVPRPPLAPPAAPDRDQRFDTCASTSVHKVSVPRGRCGHSGGSGTGSPVQPHRISRSARPAVRPRTDASATSDAAERSVRPPARARAGCRASCPRNRPWPIVARAGRPARPGAAYGSYVDVGEVGHEPSGRRCRSPRPAARAPARRRRGSAISSGDSRARWPTSADRDVRTSRRCRDAGRPFARPDAEGASRRGRGAAAPAARAPIRTHVRLGRPDRSRSRTVSSTVEPRRRTLGRRPAARRPLRGRNCPPRVDPACARPGGTSTSTTRRGSSVEPAGAGRGRDRRPRAPSPPSRQPAQRETVEARSGWPRRA